MTERPIPLLQTLGHGGDRALAVASALCMLIKDGSQLGELEDYQIPDPDQPDAFRDVRGIPQLWLERLQRAADVGAFERLSVEAIVERILGPPAADQI